MDNVIEDPKRQWLLLVVIALALFLDGLDGTIVNVVLPDIAADMNIGLGTTSWVVTVYFLVMAGLILVIGKIADSGAIKRLFVSGLLIFALSSLACGLSFSLEVLLVFRAVQGVGAAMMATTAFMVCVKFLPRRMTAFALSVSILGTSLGAAVGPTLGSVLAEMMSWHLVFFINVPIGIVAAAIAVRAVPKDTGFQSPGFDVRGAALLFVMMVTGLYVVESSPSHGFDTLSAACLAVCIVCLALFVMAERRSADPVLKLYLFRYPRLVAAIIALILINLCYMGCLYLLPFYLQIEMGLDTIGSGLYLLIPAVATLVFCLWIGKLADRMGNRIFVVIGCMCMVFALAMFAVMDVNQTSLLVVGLFLLGTTWGIAGGPIGSRMVENVPDADRPSASSLLSFFIYFGCALGTASFAGLFGFGSGIGGADISSTDPATFLEGFGFAMMFGVLFAVVALVLSAAVREGRLSHGE